jgi:hypothetical protein
VATTRCGAAAQRHHLRVDRQPAHRQHGLELRRQRPRRRGLRRQFARGGQHQRAQAARALASRVGQQALQQRQQEGAGLARAGGRLHQHGRGLAGVAVVHGQRAPWP